MQHNIDTPFVNRLDPRALKARRRRYRLTREQFFSAQLPSMSRARDIDLAPELRSPLARTVWRFVTYRLTQVSRWFLALSLICFILGYNTLDIQLYVPFTYMLGIWVVTVLCSLLLKPRVALATHYIARVRGGETLSIEVDILQQRHMLGAPMTLIPNCLPPALDAESEAGVFIPPLRRGERAHVRMGIVCHRRGLHRWPGFRVECDFPFSLYRAYRTYPDEQAVMVYPRFTPLTRLTVPTSPRYQPGGVVFASTLGESLEYIGNREYREGDNIRDIDWRATARLNMPIVREYREEYFLRVGVILDTYLPEAVDGRLLSLEVQQAQAANFERAVSIAAAVSDFMARSDYIVDLFAAGPNLFHLTAGRSIAYLDQILDILACVEGNLEEPFDVLEPEIVQNLAQISSVVCILLDWNQERQAFVERLRREGSAVKVIVVRDTACTLDPTDTDLPGGITLLNSAALRHGPEEL